MKITLEPRKTTWVPFIDSKARLTIHWTAKIEYTTYSAHLDTSHEVMMRYGFSGLEGAGFIPSSQVIIKENGIPLTITESVVSPVNDRFSSERVQDPFVEVTDKLASIKKSKVTSRQLSRRMIERSWSEKITRSIKIENKTGRQVSLALTVVDRPAEELVFVSSTPAPDRTEQPEYIYAVTLEPDAVQVIKVELKLKSVEKLELPPEQAGPPPKPRPRRQGAEQQQQPNVPQMEAIQQCAEPVDFEAQLIEQEFFEEDDQ